MKRRYRAEFYVTMYLTRWVEGESVEEVWTDIVRTEKERLLDENDPAKRIRIEAAYVRPACATCNGTGKMGRGRFERTCDDCNGRGMWV